MHPDVCATRCVHQSITGCNFNDHDGGIVWNHISEPSANHRDSQGDFSHAGGSVCFTAPASASNSSGALPQLVYVQGKFTLPNTTAHATPTPEPSAHPFSTSETRLAKTTFLAPPVRYAHLQPANDNRIQFLSCWDCQTCMWRSCSDSVAGGRVRTGQGSAGGIDPLEWIITSG